MKNDLSSCPIVTRQFLVLCLMSRRLQVGVKLFAMCHHPGCGHVLQRSDLSNDQHTAVALTVSSKHKIIS